MVFCKKDYCEYEIIVAFQLNSVSITLTIFENLAHPTSTYNLLINYTCSRGKLTFPQTSATKPARNFGHAM
jgi:hypothetical protein